MAEYIGSFTITVVCVIVLSFLLRALMPRSSLEKYVNFVIGIIVTITLVGSFANIDVIDFDSIIAAGGHDSFSKENAYELYNTKIADSFKERLALRVCELVSENTKNECEADIMLDIDTDGQILGVSGIYVRVYGMCDKDYVRDMVARSLEVGTDIVYIGGANGD